MSRRIAAAFLIFALGLSIESAHAGPSSAKIAQFELAVRRSTGNPNAGPFAPQSIGAQIDRQPTPASVKRAEERAQMKSLQIVHFSGGSECRVHPARLPQSLLSSGNLRILLTATA